MEYKNFESFLDAVEIEIKGYGLEYSETLLFFYKSNPNKENKWVIEVNEQLYTFKNFGSGICVAKGDVDIEIDYNNYQVITEGAKAINYNYMSRKSPSAKKILDKINSLQYVHIAFYGLISFDGKLFIYQTYVNRHWIGYSKSIPPIIYELNFEEDTVKYAGYLKDFKYGVAGMEYETSWGEAFFDNPSYNKPIEFMAKIVKTN